MTSVLAPVKTTTLQGIAPDVIQSCVLAPPPPTPAPEPEDVIYAPVAPGITYGSLPVITTGTTPGNLVIVDTSPDQIIGCCNDVGTDPQGRLNALFPAAISGDGVVDRASNDIWVFDGATWNNVGPTPGPTLTVTSTIPPWNEIVVYDARVRTRLEVNGLAYALELLTEPVAYGITLGLIVRSAPALLRVPATDNSIAALLPIVSGGASVMPPAAATTTLAAAVPQVSSGGAVIAPSTDISFAASMVPYVGPRATVVQATATALTMASHAPSVVGGASVSVPFTDTAITTHTPTINIVWGANIIATTGTFGVEEPSPVNNYFARRIFVATYTAAEMTAACSGATSATIYGMRFTVSSAPTYQPFPDYAIGAKNTTNLASSNNSGTNGGTFTAVRAAQSQSFTTGEYVELLFDTPIAWTGNNFVFSWAWCATSNTSSTGQAPRGGGTSYYAQTDAAGCYTITSSVTNSQSRRPVLQLLHKV